MGLENPWSNNKNLKNNVKTVVLISLIRLLSNYNNQNRIFIKIMMIYVINVL